MPCAAERDLVPEVAQAFLASSTALGTTTLHAGRGRRVPPSGCGAPDGGHWTKVLLAPGRTAAYPWEPAAAEHRHARDR